MRRTALAAPLLITSALVIAGGASAEPPAVPAGSVATVGAQQVTKATFTYWLRSALRGGGGEAGIYDPPAFERCAKSARRRIGKPRRKPGLPALRRRCRREYQQVSADVMQFLVQALWVSQEANARGLTVSPARVRRNFESQRRQAFVNRRAYRQFLRESGLTEADILFRIKLDLLQTKLTQDATSHTRPVTEAEVVAYYRRHKRELGRTLSARERAAVRNLLQAEREQRALDAFIRSFRKRYRAVTGCAPGHVVAECGNR